MGRRYEISGLVEGQVEPGSRGRVLRNLIGINRKREMDRVEMREQLRAMDELFDAYGRDHRFTAEDIRGIHRTWLGPVYAWAGQYRKVNLSKGDFTFAVADHIPRLMEDFERNILGRYTPCRSKDLGELVHALAVVHTELILIHPFREGNGKTARMLATLMGLQSGLPPLDFGTMGGKSRRGYYAAVQAGMGGDYVSMEKIFSAVIRRTLRKRA
jgi:cell filamentation protein